MIGTEAQQLPILINLRYHIDMIRSLIIAFSLVAIRPCLVADTITLDGVADSTVRQGGGLADSNLSGNLRFRSDDTGGTDDRRTFLKFDSANLSGLSSPQIASAVIRLYVDRVDGDGVVTVASVLADWSETMITWNNMPATGAVLASRSFSSAEEGTVVSIDITSQVKAWADGNPNYGLALLPNAGSGVSARWASKENTAVNVPPVIEVTTSSSSGSAYIPQWFRRYVNNNHLHYSNLALSNITDHDVDVVIGYFDEDGDMLSDDNDSTTGAIVFEPSPATNYLELSPANPDLSGTVTFTMPPRTSVFFAVTLGPSSFDFGFGEIAWSCEAEVEHALIGHGAAGYYTFGNAGVQRERVGVPINEGRPF